MKLPTMPKRKEVLVLVLVLAVLEVKELVQVQVPALALAVMEPVQVDQLELSLTGAGPATALAAARLYRDDNGDGLVNGSDTLLDDGVISAGTITFATGGGLVVEADLKAALEKSRE